MLRRAALVLLALALGACASSPAIEQSLRRAETGDAAAQYQVGVAYLIGTEIGPDPEAAARWLRRAAEAGNADAELDLGILYYRGLGVPRDLDAAFRWFARAAGLGNVKAQANVGVAYTYGHGVKQDLDEGLRWLRQAAARGDAVAEFQLGVAYGVGRGVERDNAEAMRWLRRAADRGDKDAQFTLAAHYWDGLGVTRNYPEAVRWLRRAAEQANGAAEAGLAIAYLEGLGVDADTAEAIYWLRLGAEHGSMLAQNDLGVAYESGKGVPVDYEEAALWVLKAAEQGNAGAQVNAGAYYERGRGVPRDLVRAWVFYDLGAEKAEPRATMARERLQRSMSPADVDAARQLAREVRSAGSARLKRDRPSALTPAPALTPGAGRADLIPRSVLYLTRAVGSPRLSPDGARLAYVLSENGLKGVRVRTLAGGEDRAVTEPTEREVSVVGWGCDGTFVLTSRALDGDDEQLTRIDVGTRASLDIGSEEMGLQRPLGGMRGCLAETGSLFVAGNGTVYRVNLVAGTVVRDTLNPGDVIEWLADDRGRVRVALARTREGETIVRARESEDAPWRVVQRWGQSLPFVPTGHLWAMERDGRSVILAAPAGRNGTLAVGRLDSVTGALTVLAADPDYDVVDAVPDDGRVGAYAVSRARREWTAVSAALREDFAVIGRLGGDVYLLDRDGDDRTWVLGIVRDAAPPEYVLFDRDTRTVRRLFEPDPVLAAPAYAPMRPISFAARDGRRIAGYLTLPLTPAPGRPLVMLVHGGPWARDTWGFDPLVQWLASRGYTVLQVNFRGSLGYGAAFLSAGYRQWAGAMLDDLEDARRWAEREGHAGDGRACVMGASYGGYAALMAASAEPSAFRCAISISAPSSLAVHIRTRWGPTRWVWEERVGSLERDEALLRASSPIARASTLHVPVLIAHGAEDSNVLRVHSDVMVAALRRLSRPVSYAVFPGDGHGATRMTSWLRFLALAEVFLGRSLGGRVEPPGPGEEWDTLLR